MTEKPKKALGRILLKQRALSKADLERELQKHAGDQRDGIKKPLATQLTEHGVVSEVDALKALSEQMGLPGIDLAQVCVRLADLDQLSQADAERWKVLPILVRQDRVFVAMANPTDAHVVEELEFRLQKKLFAYVALDGPLLNTIRIAYELREKGRDFYVGARCPEHVLEKMRVPPGERGESSSRREALAERRFRPSTRSMRAVEDSGQLVVNEDMEKAPEQVASDELIDEPNSEVSVITELTDDGGEKAGRVTILIVLLDGEVRAKYRNLLEGGGYRVREAARGLQALRIIKQDAPDVLVVDATLPELNGFEIARRVRGSARYGHIPIVMLTSLELDEDLEDDVRRSYGVVDVLKKPLAPPDLARAVTRAERKSPPECDPNAVAEQAHDLLAKGLGLYKKGDIDGARDCLENGTRLDPLGYRLRFHLGLLYGKIGALYDAIQSLETAVQINGSHFPALKNLAILYQKAGFRDRSIEVWERAIANAPDDATRKELRGHLEALRCD